MSYSYGFSFPDPTTGFLKTIIGHFTKLVSVAPPGKFGEKIDLNLEYTSQVSTVESTVLNFNGLVQYLYIKVYGKAIPTTPSNNEKEQIYSIYDALKVPRPIL